MTLVCRKLEVAESLVGTWRVIGVAVEMHDTKSELSWGMVQAKGLRFFQFFRSGFQLEVELQLARSLIHGVALLLLSDRLWSRRGCVGIDSGDG